MDVDRCSYTLSIAGAGLYADKRRPSSDFVPGPVANNSLIVSAGDGLRLFCVSNSSQSGVGMITTRNGTTLTVSGTNTDDLWILTNPSDRPGVLRLQTRTTSTLMNASDQGIYTCTIPDSTGNTFVFNVGLYPSDFNGKY